MACLLMWEGSHHLCFNLKVIMTAWEIVTFKWHSDSLIQSTIATHRRAPNTNPASPGAKPRLSWERHVSKRRCNIKNVPPGSSLGLLFCIYCAAETRLRLSSPLWHRKDMSRLVDGKKKRRIGINVKCSVNFSGSYRCAELQWKPLNSLSATIKWKLNHAISLYPWLLLTARWALRWLQRCRAMQHSPSPLQVSQPH